MELEKIISFLEEINKKSTRKKNNVTTENRTIKISDKIAVLSIDEDSDGGTDWFSEHNRYYFKIEVFLETINSLKTEKRVKIDYDGVHSYESYQHDQMYPEEDARSGNVQPGRVKAELLLEEGVLKINNLEFKPKAKPFYWKCDINKDPPNTEIQNLILKELYKNEK